MKRDVYSPAYAEIVSEDTVKVYSPLVSEPVNVTYAFETMNNTANLVNGDGIPASPFRTKTYNDSENVADDSVKYYNTQDWMLADGNEWQNTSYNNAGIKEFWTVKNSNGAMSLEFDSEHKSQGVASLKLTNTAGNTVTATPKINVFGRKTFDLSNYQVMSVDVSATSTADMKLIITAADGSIYYVKPANMDNAKAYSNSSFVAITFDLTTLIDSQGNGVDEQSVEAALKNAGISFEFTSENDSVINLDNILVGTSKADDTFELGDVNDDTSIDVRDLVRMKKYIADVAVRIRLQAADLEPDGDVNALDLTAFRRMLLEG